MLDCAIHISLMLLELHLYERIIEGRDLPITHREADEVDDAKWSKFVQNKTITKYLSKIGDLEILQKSAENRE